jgi:hypothetical protein
MLNSGDQDTKCSVEDYTIKLLFKLHLNLIADEYKDFKRGDDPVRIKISKMLFKMYI